MEKLLIHKDRCKGCYYCVNACPKQALTHAETINVKGYVYVECNEEKCIKCGICYNVCPDNVFELVEA